MTGWQNSRSIDQKHEHNLITDSKGQEVCSSCHQIVIKPITSSDDPRLTEAGFMRSDHHEKSDYAYPLHMQLMSMYSDTQGEFPIAPYLCIVQDEHVRRGDIYDIDIWEALANKAR